MARTKAHFRFKLNRAEKFHLAMVPHYGTENSSILDEVEQLGAELQQLIEIAGTQVQAQIGLLFSYENLWALEVESKPTHLDGWEVGSGWYNAFASKTSLSISSILIAISLITSCSSRPCSIN